MADDSALANILGAIGRVVGKGIEATGTLIAEQQALIARLQRECAAGRRGHRPVKTDPIIRLVDSYRRAMRLCGTAAAEYRAATEALAAVGEAHSFPTHKYAQYLDRTWWRWSTLEYEGRSEPEYDWVAPPAVPLNREVGERIYRAWMRLNTTGVRVGIIRKALAMEIGP